MFFLLNTLWSVWMIKYILFWLYLWQLKEYHTGRFIDHFRTHKGKKLLFSFEQILKLALLVFFVFVPNQFSILFFILFLVYLFEFLVFAKNIFLKTFKKPVKTFKTLFLAFISFVVAVVFLVWASGQQSEFQPAYLIIFDIFTPLVISIIILIFQPFFVAIRKKTLRQAQDRLGKIKSVSGLKVIAITGSYGKTSTKEFLSTILSKKFKVLSTKEHQNSEIGVAKCILGELRPGHQIFIAEVGAYNKGKVKEVCNMLKPKIGIVTGVNQQHMALFGSMENLLSAEGGGELAEILSRDGLLVVNGDNKYCLDLLKKSNNLPPSREKKYSLSNKLIGADIWTEDILVEKDSISFLAINKNKEMGHFKVNVLGKQNVQNLLAGILVARELGMSIEEISDACKSIKQEQAGMVLKQGKHGINIVDSSYSANPDGVFADLDYLSIFAGKKVIVMPCLIELGSKSSEIHYRIGKKIGEVCDLAIITSKDKFSDLEKGFIDVIARSPQGDVAIQSPGTKKIIFLENPEEISVAVTTFCKSGDAVLLEGRGPLKLHELL